MKAFLKPLLVCLLFISLFQALFACGRNPPIRIGFIAGLSGRVADLGVSGRNGVMLALEQKNDQGGIKGRNLELIVRDDQQNPDTAIKAVKELLALEIGLIIGPMTSNMAMAMVPLVNRSKTFLISPTVTTKDLVDMDDHFLRVLSTTKTYAAKSARYQFDILGRRKVTALYDIRNKSYTESWLNDFFSEFEEKGGDILKVKSFHSDDDIAFYDMVIGLLGENPDLFVIVANAVDAALICQQVRKINGTISIVISEWGSTERFIELAGSTAEGVYAAQFLDREDGSDQYRTFVKGYKERFGQEPGFAGVAGYDTAQVVLEALSNQRKNETLKQTILRQKSFQGIQQLITINQFGDADRPTFITTVNDGRYVKLE